MQISALSRMSLADQEVSSIREWNSFFSLMIPTGQAFREGTVYDVPGCELGHRGEELSFDAILHKHRLTQEVNRRLSCRLRSPPFPVTLPNVALVGVTSR